MESGISNTAFWAILTTIGFFGMCLATAHAGDTIRDLRTELASAQAIEMVQESYIRGLQARLDEANKLNGALELENTTDCQ